MHTVAPVVHGVGYAPWSQRAYGLKVDDEALDLFLFDGANGAQILGQYTGLTGRAPPPPLWSLGLILSKAYYRTADEILAVAREVRDRGMPCDTITFDGRAWQDTDTRFAFEWDPSRYPDPAGVIAQLKALDFRICVWEYPLVSVRNPLFAELAAKGWLLKDDRTGEAYRYQWDLEPFGKVLTPLPESGLLDFTHPDAYAYWRDRHRELFEIGVDMIKPDFGEQVEPHMVASDGARGDALHNVYALLYNRCVHEAASLYAKDGGFLFSRAAWAGSQRYPSQWGGDPQADWGGLAASIRGGLSWGMTGAPFYATDVGGFYGDQRDPVLYVRWAQASVFSAHMRLHGIGAREPWSYGAGGGSGGDGGARAALSAAALPVAGGGAGVCDGPARAARDGARVPRRARVLGLRPPVLLRRRPARRAVPRPGRSGPGLPAPGRVAAIPGRRARRRRPGARIQAGARRDRGIRHGGCRDSARSVRAAHRRDRNRARGGRSLESGLRPGVPVASQQRISNVLYKGCKT